MEKYNVTLVSLTVLGILLSQIQIARALQQTYTWHPTGEDPNGYQVSLISSDNWQVDTEIDITLRFILTYKNMWLDQTETDRIKVILTSENFIMDSGFLSETSVLNDISEYWERVFSFNIPAEKVSRGQALDVAITFILDITQVSNSLGGNARISYTAENLDDPIYTAVFRPFLSNFELIIVIAVAVIVIGGTTGFILYRRGRKAAKPLPLSSPPTR